MVPPIQPERAPVGDPPVVFPRSTAVEVLAATRYVRSMYRNTVPGRRRRGDGGGGGSGVVFGQVTGSAISSGGSGTVTGYKPDGVTLSSRTYTAYLFFSGEVFVGKRVYLANVLGRWHIIAADC